MLFFGRKKREKEKVRTEEKVQAIKEDPTLKAQKAIDEAEKLNRLLKRVNRDKDITLKMLLAMGGDRRIKS